jgi:hypothetical protein
MALQEASEAYLVSLLPFNPRTSSSLDDSEAKELRYALLQLLSPFCRASLPLAIFEFVSLLYDIMNSLG